MNSATHTQPAPADSPDLRAAVETLVNALRIKADLQQHLFEPYCDLLKWAQGDIEHIIHPSWPLLCDELGAEAAKLLFRDLVRLELTERGLVLCEFCGKQITGPFADVVRRGNGKPFCGPCDPNPISRRQQRVHPPSSPLVEAA